MSSASLPFSTSASLEPKQAVEQLMQQQAQLTGLISHTLGIYQHQQQQQIKTSSVHTYSLTPTPVNTSPPTQTFSYSKGKAESKGKGSKAGGKGGKGTQWSLPYTDPTLPVTWYCRECACPHNYEGWWCRNLYCRAPRPDDTTTPQGTQNQKGQGKGGKTLAAAVSKKESQRNTPAQATLREFCPADQFKELWPDTESDPESCKIVKKPTFSTHPLDVFNRNSQFAPTHPSPFGDLFICQQPTLLKNHPFTAQQSLYPSPSAPTRVAETPPTNVTATAKADPGRDDIFRMDGDDDANDEVNGEDTAEADYAEAFGDMDTENNDADYEDQGPEQRKTDATTVRQAMLDHAIAIGAPPSIIEESKLALGRAKKEDKERSSNKLPLLKKKQSVASSHVHQHEQLNVQLINLSDHKRVLQTERDKLAQDLQTATTNAQLIYDMAVRTAGEQYETGLEANRIATEETENQIRDTRARISKVDKAFIATQAGLDAAIQGKQHASAGIAAPTGAVATQVLLNNWMTSIERMNGLSKETGVDVDKLRSIFDAIKKGSGDHVGKEDCGTAAAVTPVQKVNSENNGIKNSTADDEGMGVGNETESEDETEGNKNKGSTKKKPAKSNRFATLKSGAVTKVKPAEQKSTTGTGAVPAADAAAAAAALVAAGSASSSSTPAPANGEGGVDIAAPPAATQA